MYFCPKYVQKKQNPLPERVLIPILSGRQDSNLRPLAPHASALPGCATSRTIGATNVVFTKET